LAAIMVAVATSTTCTIEGCWRDRNATIAAASVSA
jgi:hypothetical protein